MDEFLRIDVALVAQGLAASRERARALIDAGLVAVNGVPVQKPATKILDGDGIEVLGEVHPYVSRGGLKLEKALRVFGADVRDRVCADIGASTGGFTDVLLKNGARRVYAVDVGTGQLDPSLAADPRVVSMEHVNARSLRADMFAQRPTLAVMDVSFISIRLILPALVEVLGDAGRVITLVKPQFEIGRAGIGKRGIVASPAAHRQVLADLVAFAPTVGWRVRALDVSPITGGDGNVEFLADLMPAAACDTEVAPARIDVLAKG